MNLFLGLKSLRTRICNIYLVSIILFISNNVFAQDSDYIDIKTKDDKWELAGSVGPTYGIFGKEKWGLEISIFNMQNYYNRKNNHEINHWYNQLGGVFGFENSESNQYLKIRLGVEYIPKISLIIPEMNVSYSTNGKIGIEIRTTLLHLVFIGVDVLEKDFRMGLMFKIPIPPPSN